MNEKTIPILCEGKLMTKVSEYQKNILAKINNGYVLYRDSMENKWYIKKGNLFEQIKTCTGKSLLKGGKLKQLKEGDMFNNTKVMEIYTITKRGE